MGKRGEKEPWETAENWQQLAVGLGLVTIIGVAFLTPWVLEASTDENLLHRVQVVGAIAALGAAIVTFCTVNWRGLVATRQTEVAQAQLASANENNLALLLQKGAELLAGDGNRAHLAAGIATLQAVITAENPKFAREAMELVADLIDERFQNDNSAPLFRAAVDALRAGFNRGFVAGRLVDFSWGPETNGFWEPFVGVSSLRYRGGALCDYDETVLPQGAPTLQCEETDFLGCKFKRVSMLFSRCNFFSCAIEIVSLPPEGEATFHRCDFSGAKVTGSVLATVKFDQCFYRRDNPPEFPPDWMEHLSVLEEPETA
jgi:hypothetical protein